MEALLDSGISVDQLDAEKRSALHLAAYNGDDKLAMYSHKEMPNKFQTNLFFFNKFSFYSLFLRLLLRRGASTELVDSEGRTPLHWAAYNGFRAFTVALLDGKASPDARDNGGRTPLIYASHNGHRAVAEVLIDYGADMYIRDHEGKIAYDHALYLQKEQVVSVLAKRMDPNHPALQDNREADDENAADDNNGNNNNNGDDKRGAGEGGNTASAEQQAAANDPDAPAFVRRALPSQEEFAQEQYPHEAGVGGGDADDDAVMAFSMNSTDLEDSIMQVQPHLKDKAGAKDGKKDAGPTSFLDALNKEKQEAKDAAQREGPVTSRTVVAPVFQKPKTHGASGVKPLLSGPSVAGGEDQRERVIQGLREQLEALSAKHARTQEQLAAERARNEELTKTIEDQKERLSLVASAGSSLGAAARHHHHQQQQHGMGDEGDNDVAEPGDTVASLRAKLRAALDERQKLHEDFQTFKMGAAVTNSSLAALRRQLDEEVKRVEDLRRDEVSQLQAELETLRQSLDQQSRGKGSQMTMQQQQQHQQHSSGGQDGKEALMRELGALRAAEASLRAELENAREREEEFNRSMSAMKLLVDREKKNAREAVENAGKAEKRAKDAEAQAATASAAAAAATAAASASGSGSGSGSGARQSGHSDELREARRRIAALEEELEEAAHRGSGGGGGNSGGNPELTKARQRIRELEGLLEDAEDSKRKALKRLAAATDAESSVSGYSLDAKAKALAQRLADAERELEAAEQAKRDAQRRAKQSEEDAVDREASLQRKIAALEKSASSASAATAAAAAHGTSSDDQEVRRLTKSLAAAQRDAEDAEAQNKELRKKLQAAEADGAKTGDARARSLAQRLAEVEKDLEAAELAKREAQRRLRAAEEEADAAAGAAKRKLASLEQELAQKRDPSLSSSDQDPDKLRRLTQRVAGLEEELREAEAAAKELRKKLKAAEAERSDLEAAVSAARKRVAELEKSAAVSGASNPSEGSAPGGKSGEAAAKRRIAELEQELEESEARCKQLRAKVRAAEADAPTAEADAQRIKKLAERLAEAEAAVESAERARRDALKHAATLEAKVC